MKPVFINRNESAELSFFYDRYESAVAQANEWIIPLLKEFGSQITIEVICDYLKGDTRERFIDLLISKKTSERILPAELKRLQDEANKEFDDVLLKVIKQGHRVSATKKAQVAAIENYNNKIKKLNGELERTRHMDSRAAIQREIDSVYAFLGQTESKCTREIESIIEDEKRCFSFVAEEKYYLESVSGFLILDCDTLKIDREKVAATFAVYADTPKEVKLIEKLRQLADVTNEIYGSDYPGALSAFCTFFTTEKGKVVLKPDIQKDAIRQYAKNM